MSTLPADAPIPAASPPTTAPDAVPTPSKPAPKKPATAKKRSTAKKPTGTIKAGNVPSPKVGTKAKRDAAHPWLADAVRAARHLSGMKKGAGGDATLAYPGPAQHLKIRARVTEMIDGPVTVDSIVKLSGVKNLATLRRIAIWDSDKSELVPLRPLSKEFSGDGWATGRFLSAVLVAWADEIRKAKS